MNRHIRPVALGLFWRGDELLVFEGRDPTSGEVFYRPLGGGIQFGERGDEALQREFAEELAVELGDVRYLGALENICAYNGERSHEIVQLYEATFADSSLYDQEHFEVHEEDDLVFPARWVPLSELRSDGPPLYPEGLLAYLNGEGASRETP